MYQCLNCVQCKHVIRRKAFIHPGTGETIQIRGYHTCLSQFVIYVIVCWGNRAEKLGHTSDQLRFMVLETIPPLKRGSDCELRLKQREVWWINKLNTLHPHGLNKDYDLYLFL
ncbi:hypothetical protein XELAEV_18042847mg [Xenopus laevis]|uniref:Uncharacterized protein n=1 Tax=Xenopus laevis TaxID=8355 RepID=A0A974C514_XENLA|nr:hypothetical protein XELAEV_18042847mg [Xenopus laevis]